MPDPSTEEAFAAECLMATMRLVDEIQGYLDEKNGDLLLRAIYLDGRYPDTKLIVECLSTSSSGRTDWSVSIEIWGEAYRKFGSPPISPTAFAGIVASNIMENAWDEPRSTDQT
jgi:hypothetical protein